MIDISRDEFERSIARAADILASWRWAASEQTKVWNAIPAARLRAAFNQRLPTQGQGLERTLEEIEVNVYGGSVRTYDPRFMGYYTSGGHPAGVVANFLADGLNQNAAKWHVSPAATELEQVVVRWIAEFIGFDPASGGVLTTGGTIANLIAMTVARNATLADAAENGVDGQPQLVTYASDQAHASIERALSQIGLGSRSLRRISTTSPENAMDIDALRRSIEADLQDDAVRPFCVAGSAGTTNTGAVDALDAIADLCDEFGLWFHIDGAYGAPAAATRAAGALFKGIERADSISIDPHKWLFAPFESGCVLIRDANRLRSTYAYSAEYLESDKGQDGDRIDFMDLSPELTRGVRALKVWAIFKSYGADGVRAAIDNNIVLMRHLGEIVERSDDFELMSPVTLSVVCFRYAPSALRDAPDRLNALNAELARRIEADGRIFLSATKVRSHTVLRAASVNYALRQENVEEVFAVVREIAGTLEA